MPGCRVMQNRDKLLQRLADGHFHSGQDLAAELGISRAGVWKYIKAINLDTGLKIDAVRGRGYRLRKGLEFLESQIIKGHFSPRLRHRIGQLHIHQTIDSTNSWLMSQAANRAESGTVCLAEQQTAGKGRHGRVWVSPFGRNIYLSLLWRFDMDPGRLTGLSLACGIAVVRTLRQFGCPGIGLKWPNDILWRNKKLAGLLLEVAGETAGPAHVVVGVGVNLSLGEDGLDIEQPWIDLESIPNMREFSRNEMVASLLQNLVDVIDGYQAAGLKGFIDEWNRFDLLRGRKVRLHSVKHVFVGEHLGIDAAGGIRLKIDGESRTFYAGEVSLRSFSE